MPAKVVCPSCHMSLNAPDDLLGQTVKCEECGQTFTARAPARPRPEPAGPGREKSRFRRRPDDDEDADDRPRPSRRTSRYEDDEDDRPRRRVKKKGSNALPFILAGGGLVLFVLLAAGVGLYLLVSSKGKRADATAPPAGNSAPQLAPLPAAAPLPN